MLPVPISKTKIIPPRRRDELLTRKRLLDMLFDALDNKLVLVSAPAGYGKTSLLIDLFHQSEYKCCWLSLDELDREPQRFIAYLLASIAEQFPGFGNQTAAVLNGLISIDDEIERLAVMLINETYEMLNEHFVLILDDFHILENAKHTHDFLNRFIQLAHDHCHIVISSRTLTDLYDLPLMVAREQVSGLDFSDLAFHKEEIQALMLQNNKIHIPDDEAEKMIAETEGWITGLQFSGVNLTGKNKNNPISKRGADLFDYLGQQVLDRQDSVMCEFLLRTSVMEEFDAELCEAVLSPFYKEKQDWDGFIRAVLKNNLFALPVGTDGSSLRYHHLFRDYLFTRLKKDRPEEVKPILARLGQAYENIGEWEKAYYFTKQLEDANSLASMIEHACVSISQRSIPATESWLNELPPSILNNRPGIIAIRGTIFYMKGDFDKGLDLLNRAEKIFRKEQDIPNLALILIRRATGYRFLGNYTDSIKDAEEVIQITDGKDEMQSLFAEALRLKGLVLFRLGQARLALEFLENSLDAYIAVKDEVGTPLLLMETGMVYYSLGQYEKAGDVYQKALQIWKQEGNLLRQANLLNNMGVMYHAQGEYEKSVTAYEDGLLCARRSTYIRLEALISIGLGDLYTELQDFEIANQNYQHASTLISDMQEYYLLFSLQIGQVNLLLMQNEIEKANSILKEMESKAELTQSHYENGYFHLVLAKKLMFEGSSLQAIQTLKSAESHFVEDGRELECTIAQIWLTAAYCVNNDIASAHEKIKIVVGNQGKINHAILMTIAQTRPWLEGLQKDNEIGRLLRDLFVRSERAVANLPAIRRELRRHSHVISIPAPQLSIQAFGPSVVSVGGKILSNSDWQTQAVRDLFFFFLTKSKPLTKEQIAEMIWQEVEEPAKIKLKFKNDMYRLRRAVGQDIILFENPFYSFNRSMDYEYDVEAFESYLVRAKSVNTPKEQIIFYRKAVELVRGPYLNDLYFDWVVPDRERLSQMYLNALVALAELYQKVAELDEGLVICQRAIEYEPTFEAAYRLAMQIHHRLKDRSSIIRTYQACVDALQQLQGMPPSKETENLYLKLIS